MSDGVRRAMLALTIVGAVLMIVVESTTLYEIKVVTVPVPSGGSERAGSHHGTRSW